MRATSRGPSRIRFAEHTGAGAALAKIARGAGGTAALRHCI
jgi:hypothetical protein